MLKYLFNQNGSFALIMSENALIKHLIRLDVT